MMWLTVILSAFDEAASTEARRASTHEVARRLGVPWRREREPGPPAPVTPSTALPTFASTQEAFLSILPEVVSRETALTFHYLARLLGSWEPDRKVADFGPEDVGISPESGVFPLRIPTGFSRDSDVFVPWLFRELSARLEVDALEPRRGETWEEQNMGVLHRIVRGLLPSFFDWVRATHPDLSRYTIGSALAATEAWHGELAKARSKDAPRSGVVVAQFKDGARIERLLSRPELDEEGNTMGHCIGTHADALRTGSRFFSYREANGMPSASMEIKGVYKKMGQGTTILELKGEDNEEVKGMAARRRIKEWLQSDGIQLGSDADKVRAKMSFLRVVPVSFWPESERPILETKEDRELDRKLRLSHPSSGPKIADWLKELGVLLSRLSGAENLSQNATALVLLEQEKAATGIGMNTRRQDAAIARIRRDLDPRMGLSAEETQALSPYDLRDMADREMNLSRPDSTASKAYRLIETIVSLLGSRLERDMDVERARDDRDDAFQLAVIKIDHETSHEYSGGAHEVRVLVSAESPIFDVIWEDIYADETREVGSFPTLMAALQGASLVQTVTNRRQQMNEAETKLEKLGLSVRLPPSIAHHDNVPTFLAGAREAGFTIPKAIERRFRGAEWVSEGEPG